jgi:hypothetical protein
MRELEALDIRYYECEGCFGIWLDWWSGEPSGVARLVPPHDGHGPVGQRGGACPRDGDELVARAYLDAGPEVERCPTCLGLFATRARVPVLAAFHERIPFEPPELIHFPSLLSRFWYAFVK